MEQRKTTGRTVKKADNRAAKQAIVKAVKKVGNRAAKQAIGKAVKETDNRTAKQATGKAAKEADNRAAKQAIVKAVKKADKRTAKQVADKAAKETDNRAAKQMAGRTAKEADSSVTKEAAGSLHCPVQKKCGGCKYQGMTYRQQRHIKQRQVEKLLGPFGKVQPFMDMEMPYYYRNKVHAAIQRLRSGEIVCGTYEANSHKIVPVEQCLIEDRKCGEIIRSIRDMCKSFKIKPYDEDTGYGLLRHVLVRRGFRTGEVMVVLVLGSPILPSKNNFVKALLERHPEITTILLNVNDKKTSMVLGERDILLYGRGYIEDILCGRVFRISPKSFYQVNPVQTEVLYRKAMEFADLTGRERVLDAYCGVGTIGLIAAKDAKEVIGVELNPDAVRDARINAKQNYITNVRFATADAGKFMTDLAQQKVRIDVVFMDPPRAGSDEAFLSSLVKLGPKKVVYISCNPETLARDLQYLTKKGYRAKAIQPVDMFPWTEAVETVCLLSR